MRLRTVWTTFLYWLNHKFTSHCDECDAAKECKNCNELRLMLAQERVERQKLIELLVAKPVESVEEKEVDWEKISPRPTSWVAKREQLERDARKQANERSAESV